jgi:hypothetical protein
MLCLYPLANQFEHPGGSLPLPNPQPPGFFSSKWGRTEVSQPIRISKCPASVVAQKVAERGVEPRFRESSESEKSGSTPIVFSPGFY